jgi:hypothetical protein
MLKLTKRLAFFFVLLFVSPVFLKAQIVNYPIVDTDQKTFYDSTKEISAPTTGSSFYGQDAHYSGNQPSYTDNGDGTITDNVTGLMWQKSPDLDWDGDIDYDDKLSYSEAEAAADTFSLAGYNDWRLPTIKELYSLILFSGIDVSGYNGTSTDGLTPFINDNYFDFGYGDVDAGERIIDAQMASSTLYVSTTMNGDETMFGVNFADGRIKGYGTGPLPGQTEPKQFYIMYVRGGSNYGKNDLKDNGDKTITDEATGLMWTQDDDGNGMTWEDALEYAENATYAGYDDWRLPNAKELQSILNYSRAPDITNSAAINPMFSCTKIKDEGGNDNYPFYWTSTTHTNMGMQEPGAYAAYVCFGEALGFMEMPPNSGNYSLLDVHGAGAQRSDPKVGDPDDYPNGHGPQGDVIRIYNFVRLVRDAEPVSSINEKSSEESFFEIYPNPASSKLRVKSDSEMQSILIFDMTGKEKLRVDNLSDQFHILDISNLESGMFLIKIVNRNGGSEVLRFQKI